jgi:hypothetical protein
MCSGELAHSRNLHHPGDAEGQVRHETELGPYWTVVHVATCTFPLPPLDR